MKKTDIKAVVALVLCVAVAMCLWGCGEDEQKTIKELVEAANAANIDITRDNVSDMPSAEEVISGGTTQELVNSFEGKNANAVLTVNGEPISRAIMQFSLNDSAMSYAQSLMYVGVIDGNADSFDWNGRAINFNGSHLEYVKYDAMEDLIPRFALIAEGKRRGITLTEEDRKGVSDWLNQQKNGKSDEEFTAILNQNGCPDIATFVAMRELAVLEEKVMADFNNNPEKYATRDQLLGADERDLVTVKHILIAFNPSSVGAIPTEEEKAAAKKKAEDVLAKVNAGEDFDVLMDDFSDDVEESKEGYTFANDGTMVQEFTDASFALEIGETSGLVETDYGYHIIRRLERATGISDYMILLNKNAKIVVNGSAFEQLTITVDIGEYLNSVMQSMSK